MGNGLNMSTFPPPPSHPSPETITQVSPVPRKIRTMTAVSIILGILSLSLSVFTVSVYFYARALWNWSGQPRPGWRSDVDFWGQWNVVQTGGGSPRIVAVGGLVILSSPLSILAIICGLAAIVCGVLAFKGKRASANLVSMILGIVGVGLSAWLLSSL
jgi:hypothetical protein